MRRIRFDQIDTPGDNCSRDEIDIGASNSTFGVIKSARMRAVGLGVAQHTAPSMPVGEQGWRGRARKIEK